MIEYISRMRRHIGQEPLLLAGAGVFIYKDDRILLQKRRDNGCWANHGGCVEIGESVEDTARRELLEETGLIAGDLELLGVFSGKDMLYTYPNGDQVCIVGIDFLCCDFSGTPLQETDETTELAWFPLDALPDAISPPVIRSLRKCVEVLKARQRSAGVEAEPLVK